MVTLIDNLSLDKEERLWYEKLMRLPPFSAEITKWINLEELTNGIDKKLREDEISILVATGGIEVYPEKEDRDIFIFNSPNFNGEKLLVPYEDYKKIINNPFKHHKKALEELQRYLSNFNNKKINIIEGDIGNTGLSAARLFAIYETIKSSNRTEILVGAAPELCAFPFIRKKSLFTTLKDKLKLNYIHYNVIIWCKDPYIRRASEILGVSKIEELEDDLKIWGRFHKDNQTLSNKERKEYYEWFRYLTIKKIERLNYVNKRIEKLKNH